MADFCELFSTTASLQQQLREAVQRLEGRYDLVQTML